MNVVQIAYASSVNIKAGLLLMKRLIAVKYALEVLCNIRADCSVPLRGSFFLRPRRLL